MTVVLKLHIQLLKNAISKPRYASLGASGIDLAAGISTTILIKPGKFKIIPTGKIIDYEIIKKSGITAFDKAAELAVRNALLDPLPIALAENPPYIVTIRIVPQS